MLVLVIPDRAAAEPSAAAVAAFNSYIGTVESRIARSIVRNQASSPRWIRRSKQI